MILAIAIYYLVGIIIGIIGAEYFGFIAARKGLSREEAESINLKTAQRFGLSLEVEPAIAILLNIIGILTMPILLTMYNGYAIMQVDRLVNKKKETRSPYNMGFRFSLIKHLLNRR